MNRLLMTLLVVTLSACSKPVLPERAVLVQITQDGRCLVAAKEMNCTTLGQDLLASYPDNSLSITINVDPQADYPVLSSALNSIRQAGIEKTWVDSND